MEEVEKDYPSGAQVLCMREKTRSPNRLCTIVFSVHTQSAEHPFHWVPWKAPSISQPCVFSPSLSVICCFMLTMTMHDSLHPLTRLQPYCLLPPDAAACSCQLAREPEIKTIESSLHDCQDLLSQISILQTSGSKAPVHLTSTPAYLTQASLQLEAFFLFTMRFKGQHHGKFYTITSQTGINQPDATAEAYLPKAARGHMVMVLGWADQWNWVKVVTVSSFLF